MSQKVYGRRTFHMNNDISQDCYINRGENENSKSSEQNAKMVMRFQLAAYIEFLLIRLILSAKL